jgi:hypothetical protein
MTIAKCRRQEAIDLVYVVTVSIVRRLAPTPAHSVDGAVGRLVPMGPKRRQPQEVNVILGQPQIDAELLRKVQSGCHSTVRDAAQHDVGCGDDGDQKFSCRRCSRDQEVP